MGKGSPVMFLEKLPRPSVGALPRYALLVLAQVLQALSEVVPSRLLTAVLHHYLAKKEPAWLVSNIQPIMLEPYLHHLETSVIQVRRMSRRVRQRAVPPELFVYLRELSGQMLGLTYQCLLVGQVPGHPEG